MNVFDLFASLTLDSSAYESGLQDARMMADDAGGDLEMSLSDSAESAADAVASSADDISASLDGMSGDADSASGSFMSAMEGVGDSMASTGDEIEESSGGGLDALFNLADGAGGLGGAFGDLGGQAQNMGKMMLNALKTPLGAAAAVSAAIAGLSKLIIDGAKETAEYGDHVDKQSQKIGMSAEAYQKWDYVMQLAGTDVDNLKMGMKTLSNQAEKNSDSFQKLGISQEEVANLSKEDLFERVIEGLSSMEDGTERSALASQLLGRAGADMAPLLNQGSDAIKEQMQTAEDYGMIMSDESVKASAAFQDSGTTMKMAMDGMKHDLMDDFLPSMTSVKEGIAKMFAGDSSGVLELLEGIGGFILEAIKLIPTVIGKFAKGLAGAAVAIVKALGTALVEKVPELFTHLSEMLDNAIQKIEEWNPDEGATGGAALELVKKIGKGIIENAPVILSALGKMMLSALKAIGKLGLQFLKLGGTLMAKLLSGMVKGLVGLVRWAAKLPATIGSKIAGGVRTLIQAGGKLIQGVFSGLKQGISNIWTIGTEIVRGIWRGISSGLSWIKRQIKQWVGNVKQFLKNLFGIKSPSKWARDEIGGNIVKGLALGLEDGSGLVDSAMSGLLPDEDIFNAGTPIVADLGELEAESVVSGTVGTGETRNVFYITNHFDGVESPEEHADAFFRQLEMRLRMA